VSYVILILGDTACGFYFVISQTFEMAMIRLLTVLVLTLPTIVLAQGNTEASKAFIFESNLPDELVPLYDQKEIRATYSIRTDLNPFYLRGDFDGDKKSDYALSIVEKKTNKKGILIYHTGTKNHFVLGAGKNINEKGDDFNWMDAWKVYAKKDVEVGVGETNKLILKGEAISAFKLEASSGLFYWTGKEYRWYQQGD
jgi:hypothetical protein